MNIRVNNKSKSETTPSFEKNSKALVSEHLKVLTYESFTFQNVTQLPRDNSKRIKESIAKPLKEPTANITNPHISC